MKLKIFYILSLIACAGVVVRAQTGYQLKGKSEQGLSLRGEFQESVLEKDKKAMEKNISPFVLKEQTWSQMNDFSFSIKELIALNRNPRWLLKLCSQSINDLAICLKKDYCGMERKNDQDPYFDKVNTPGHLLLGRILEIIKAQLEQAPELTDEIDWKEMR